jgi:hypothetical protein
MLLIHGWCCDHTYFAPRAAHIYERHAHVLIDYAGFLEGQHDPEASDRARDEALDQLERARNLVPAASSDR